MYQEVVSLKGARTDRCRVIHFDSVHEFVTVKNNDKCKGIWKEHVIDEFPKSRSDWFGVKTLNEFEEIMDQGHPRFVDLVREKAVNAAPPRSLRRRKMNGDYGDEVCIHKINGGNLATAWSRKSPKLRVTARNLRLLVNISQNGNVEAEEAQWVGVAALRAAEALESAGYRISIDACCGSNGITDEESIAFIVPLKSYDAPLDIQCLTSAVCFPGFWRGAGFMNFGLAKGEIRYGFGSALSDELLLNQIIRRHYHHHGEAVEMISNSLRSSDAVDHEVDRILSKCSTDSTLQTASNG